MRFLGRDQEVIANCKLTEEHSKARSVQRSPINLRGPEAVNDPSKFSKKAREAAYYYAQSSMLFHWMLLKEIPDGVARIQSTVGFTDQQPW